MKIDNYHHYYPYVGINSGIEFIPKKQNIDKKRESEKVEPIKAIPSFSKLYNHLFKHRSRFHTF